MPGPRAKDPTTRARRNKTSTNTTLTKQANAKVPPLPTSVDWYDEVKQWWTDTWTSQPRSEWLDSDVHLLYVGARLYQMLLDPETKPQVCKALASEFRQITVQFGLTPMARRTLQWSIEPPEAAAGKTAAKRAPAKKAPARPDPRTTRRLQSVS